MNIKQVTGIYFSPTGHSKKAVRAIVSRIGGNTGYVDLTGPGRGGCRSAGLWRKAAGDCCGAFAEASREPDPGGSGGYIRKPGL